MRTLLVIFALLGLTACRATVAGDPNKPIKIEAHITLDIRQVEKTAESIEDIVSGKAPAPTPQRQSWLSDWLVPVAWADAAELKEMTPAVQQALEGRKGRYAVLKSDKAQGLVGEDNKGHAAALGGGPEVKELVDQENADRETIYRAILEQNRFPAGEIETIRAGFALEQRDRAEPGEKIQLPSGEWTTK